MQNNQKMIENHYKANNVELHHWMDNNNNNSFLNQTSYRVESEEKLTNISSFISPNKLRKIRKLRLTSTFTKIYKDKARKELRLGIYIPVTNIHYISYQLRKVLGKRILISSILKRRINVNLLRRKSILLLKINNIKETFNRNISNTLLIKNNNTKNPISALKKYGAAQSNPKFKNLNNSVMLPKFLTLNNNWKNKLINLTSNLGTGCKSFHTFSAQATQANSVRMFSTQNKLELQNSKAPSAASSANNHKEILLPYNAPSSALNNGCCTLCDVDQERNAKISTIMNSITNFSSEEANSQYLIYQFSKKNKNRYSFKAAENFLKLAFLSMGCLISKVRFSLAHDQKSEDYDVYYAKPQSKIMITLFYFCKSSSRRNSTRYNKNKSIKSKNSIDLLTKYNIKLQFLIDVLAKIFKSNIQLNLIQLKKPHYNSNILAQYLGLKSYKYRFVKLVKLLFRRLHIEKPSTINAISDSNSIIDSKFSHLGLVEGTEKQRSKYYLYPSYLAGIRIRLGGRTFKQKVIPRRTVQLIQKGSLNRANVNLIEKARFTGKTRRGSYSFTVTLGHVF